MSDGADVSAVRRRVAGELAAGGVGSAAFEADTIVARVAGVERGGLLTAPALSDEQLAQVGELTRRRVAGEPLQYVLGTACAGALDLEVGPGVFIPRPETELVLAAGLDAVRDVQSPRVVDLCSGSGYLALEIAHARPDARVHAVELSTEAVGWLRHNADRRRRAGDTAIEVHAADVTDRDVLAGFEDSVDLVVANPPYIPSGHAPTLPAEIVGHEPHSALFGGDDGLSVIRPIVVRSAELLRSGGALMIEHDDTTSDAVAAVLTADGRFGNVEQHPDLSGRPRFVTADRRTREGDDR